MKPGLPKKLLTFSRQYGGKSPAKSRNPLSQLGFFELAQSGGFEQNSGSIALKPLYEGTFFKLWSGGNREKVNQINSLSVAVERLKI
jgi:hypothetical protein